MLAEIALTIPEQSEKTRQNFIDNSHRTDKRNLQQNLVHMQQNRQLRQRTFDALSFSIFLLFSNGITWTLTQKR